MIQTSHLLSNYKRACMLSDFCTSVTCVTSQLMVSAFRSNEECSGSNQCHNKDEQNIT